MIYRYYFLNINKADEIYNITVDHTFIIISIVIATSAGMLAASIPARSLAKFNPIEVIHNA
ncbi:MAG: hypothetical protein U5K53_06515 [Halanaerobiales bacterium]|nr:hypothetical protein [Halanaerobiales bacterium]